MSFFLLFVFVEVEWEVWCCFIYIFRVVKMKSEWGWIYISLDCTEYSVFCRDAHLMSPELMD